MTGPEHYREAEHLMRLVAKDLPIQGGPSATFDPDDDTRAALAAAQVHATLALAAATAYPAVIAYHGDETGFESRGWANATAPAPVRSTS